MATLTTLITDGSLLRWEVILLPRQQIDRMLLLVPPLRDRLDAALAVGSTWNIEETPAQQLDSLTAVFVSGEPLAFGWQFKALGRVPHLDGVWYLKTADVRLFGWFPCRDGFIATSVGLTEQTKRLHLYRPFGEEVVRIREALPLDEPKYIPGDDPNAVVSNFTYPL
ncbi:MAG TPA: hypothetical protein VGJ20_03665 [Xanthobacteraceae bacterium]|jgi:hypothetical protein